MIISRIKLTNWKNFQSVDIALKDRMFLVGPNACGKSNFLDVFVFLKDVASDGLQKAVISRGGLKKIRCLSARTKSFVEISVTVKNSENEWVYELSIIQENSGSRRVLIDSEVVFKNGERILKRPDTKDEADSVMKIQTHLEQIQANQSFREIADFFKNIQYQHIVPQIVRHPESFSDPRYELPGDPYGQSFLKKMSKERKDTREARLNKITNALIGSIPNFKELNYVVDELGIPHLNAKYDHWRAKGAFQQEAQFSDGTLRLIGLLWALLENKGILLLEEPELSLHNGIVRQLAKIFYKVKKENKNQLLISTHSTDLLSDKSISASEILLLIPKKEGTIIQQVSGIIEIKSLIDLGLTPGEYIPHLSKANDLPEISLFP